MRRRWQPASIPGADSVAPAEREILPEGSAVGQMRIAHVITEAYPMGGSQLNTFYSLEYQMQANEVELVVGGDGPMVNACREAGIPVQIIPMANTLLDPFGDVHALLGLIAHFRAWKPDIVHTHTSKAGIVGRIAARLAGVPVVVHTVHAPSFQNRHSLIVRMAIRGMERLCTRLTDRIIAVADGIRDEMLASGACGPHDITTVVSGIDFRRFPDDREATRIVVRQELGIAPATRVVISVGHLTARKGHDLLIDAAEFILAVEDDVTFLIVGTGPLHPELQREIDTRGLTGRVVLSGQREDVPELLIASDVFVQTSWHEGLSRSLVEAVYCRLPVVATDVNATHEVVEDGRTGYLVPAGDVPALTDRLRVLLADPDLRTTMGARAHRSVAETRTVEVMVRSLDDLYARLVSRKAMPSRRSIHETAPRSREA